MKTPINRRHNIAKQSNLKITERRNFCDWPYAYTDRCWHFQIFADGIEVCMIIVLRVCQCLVVGRWPSCVFCIVVVLVGIVVTSSLMRIVQEFGISFFRISCWHLLSFEIFFASASFAKPDHKPTVFSNKCYQVLDGSPLVVTFCFQHDPSRPPRLMISCSFMYKWMQFTSLWRSVWRVAVFFDEHSVLQHLLRHSFL